MLITGSLGSGKTTLLRRILNTTDRRLAVLMNEFGEIAIDSKVIRGENVDIVELAGGCVCCSMTGEFEAAVREIIEKIAPEMIVVEATGVAEADALVFEIEDNLPEVRLDAVICLVDAYLSIRHPHVGYTARTQIESADVVLINKVDLVTTDEVKEVEAQIRRFNETAVMFKTMGCDIDTNLLFGIDVARHPTGISHHGEAHFESFTFTTDAKLDEEKFRDLISNLPLSIYRAKGFVLLDGNSFLFNYVVGRADLEEMEADTTQLVFIGRNMEAERETILERLKECEV
jgi:G3E family GTPase